jgi:hypothetical protein
LKSIYAPATRQDLRPATISAMRVSLYAGQGQFDEHLVGTLDGDTVEAGGFSARSYPGRLGPRNTVLVGRYSSEMEVGKVDVDGHTILQSLSYGRDYRQTDESACINASDEARQGCVLCRSGISRRDLSNALRLEGAPGGDREQAWARQGQLHLQA